METPSERVLRFLRIERDEIAVVAGGALMFATLFAGYFMLRPVRETMGITGGVKNLQWLFTATFVATLIALPAFGWIASRVQRRTIMTWTSAFFVSNLLAFAGVFAISPDDVWAARSFYVWLSVFNLLTISLAWSVLADLLSLTQAKRLFALIAAGASLGGLIGPLASYGLVPLIGHSGLLVISALLLAASAVFASYLHAWRDRNPLPPEAQQSSRSEPLGGDVLAGAMAVARSRYLATIAAFVVLLAVVSTFLYFEQAKIVEATFPDKARQTQVFSLIDAGVQTLTILVQLFFAGRIAERFGVGSLLVVVPLAMVAGFLWLAVAPVFLVLAIVMIARRVGEYALVRPGREMLYTIAADDEKYKAKNFTDTVVYRGGDAIGGWVKSALDALAQQPAIVMIAGAVVASGWALTGGYLGRSADRPGIAVTTGRE